MNVLARLCGLLDKASIAAVAASLSGIFLITAGNAVLRYCWHINLLWAYDLLRVLFVFFVFFGIPVVYWRKNHARYTFLDDRVKGAAALILHEVIHIISALVFLVIVVESSQLAVNTWAQIMPASQIRAMWLYVPLALGSAVCLVQTVYFIIGEFVEAEGDAKEGAA